MPDQDSKRFRDFYSTEAAIYHGRRYSGGYGSLFRELHHETLHDLLDGHVDGRRGLEIACGTGHTSAALAHMGVELTACDLTPQMMAQARERTARAPSRPAFVQCDALSLPYADASFDLVVSTRFAHLFPAAEQRRLLAEVHRVVAPGGRVLIDFDNWSARWLLCVPLLAYNVLRYRRLAPYAVYNRVGQMRRMFTDTGFAVERVAGVGGVHLGALAAAAPAFARELGREHRDAPLRLFAEQFMVLGRKA